MICSDANARVEGSVISVDIPLPNYTVCSICQCPADEVVVTRSVYYNNANATIAYRCHACRGKAAGDA